MSSGGCFSSSSWIVKLSKPIMLPSINSRKKIHSLLALFLFLCFHISVVWVITRFIFRLRECQFHHCKKRHIGIIMWSACLFLAWYSTILNRNSVRKMFRQYQNFEIDFNNDALFRKLRCILNVITAFLFFISSAIVSFVLIIHNMDDETTTNRFRVLSHQEMNIHAQRVIVFSQIVSSRFFYTLLPLSLLLLHFCFFSSLVFALHRCERKIIHAKSGNCVLKFMKMYSSVHKLATSVEFALSLEVLFMTSYMYCWVYVAISNVYSPSAEYDDVIKIERLFTEITLHSMFLLVVFAAAEINNRDVTLRTKINDKIFRMSLVNRESPYPDLLKRFVDSKKVIVFTGWKMFRFTRTFILTSAGVLLTYSLLILQLQ